MSGGEKEAAFEKEEEEEIFYREAFEAFDWNKNGTIPTSVCFEVSWTSRG